MGLKKKQNIVISLVSMAILTVIGAVSISSAFGAEYPEWTGVNETFSVLEARQRQLTPDLTRRSALDGSFQTQAGQYISDHIPMRTEALLANATMQRSTIKLANLLFAWPAYPTSFESKHSEIPAWNALVSNAQSPSEDSEAIARAWVNAINVASQNNPEVRFVYDLLDDTYSSPANPTHALISQPYSKEWVDENIINCLDEGVDVIFDPIESADELRTQWFSTEHHWRLTRALKSYTLIGNLLGWSRIEEENQQCIEGEWYGSTACAGLDMEHSDYFTDLLTDFSDLTCTINGIEGDRGLREEYMRGEDVRQSEPVYRFYHLWYGGAKANVIYNNPRGNGKTCLFVEHSYGVALERYIALNYSKLVCVDPQNRTVDYSLDELIKEYNPDDVVIQFGFAYLSQVKQNSPAFLGMNIEAAS